MAMPSFNPQALRNPFFNQQPQDAFFNQGDPTAVPASPNSTGAAPPAASSPPDVKQAPPQTSPSETTPSPSQDAMAPSAQQSFWQPPSFDEVNHQYGDAPIMAPPPAPHRGMLAKILLTAGNVLGNPYASSVSARDRELALENQTFERNRPAIQNQANIQRYEQMIGNQVKASEVGKNVAETGKAQIEGQIAGENLPAQELAQKNYNDLVTKWQNREVPDFEAYVNTQFQGMPWAVRRRLGDPAQLAQQIKQLPQTGKGYTIEMQDDVPKGVNIYGKVYDPGNAADAAELNKLPQGQAAIADFNRAAQAHITKRGEHLQDENFVAGQAASRQAAGFENAAAMQNRQHNFELENKRRGEVLKEDLDLNDSAQRYQQLNTAVDAAQRGNTIEAQNAVLKTLGLSLDGITKRINTTELAKFEDAGSAGQRLAGHLRGWTEGNPFPDSIWKDVKEFADDQYQAAQQKHDKNVQVINTSYGYRAPGQNAGSKGSVPVPSGGGHRIQIGNKMYDYKGSGDTADLKNYDEVK